MTPEQFKKALAENGILLSEEQERQFSSYFRLLVEWNEKMNLTAITEQEEVYLKHFYDSVAPVLFQLLPKDKEVTLVDVGAGAGFPSLPMKILYPNLQVTIVDSLNKRITFLQELTKELGLTGVQFFHDRAETFGQNPEFRGQFDFVTARAVARLNVLVELCLPLAKKGGKFIALKASQSEEEVNEAKHAIALLGGKLTQELAYELPKTGDERHIVVIEKTKETPKKYPRKPGTPNKSPLK
ncbi:MAG: 16S rRNA (guanine(527)-N(7))-methyltransferase RsmG [Lactobacillales bacterium]|nr:16S rRNA (guanine(527)-N(7))-methyltransferase RsmG [Lactobacillales bacterium]